MVGPCGALEEEPVARIEKGVECEVPGAERCKGEVHG